MGGTGAVAGDESFKLSGITQVNTSKTNRLNESYPQFIAAIRTSFPLERTWKIYVIY